MPRHKKPYIEFRDYNLPARFPVLLLSVSAASYPQLPGYRALPLGLRHHGL